MVSSDSGDSHPRTRSRHSHRHRKRAVNASFRHSYGRDPRWWRVLGLGLGVTAIVAVIMLGGKGVVLPQNDAQKFYDRALNLYEQKSYRSAVIELKNALSLDPNYSKARRLLADSYLALGQIGSVRKTSQQLEETDLPGFYEDAVVRFEAGDFSGAIIQLKKVLRENSDDTVARLLLGRSYLEIGDGYSSELALEKARSGGADVSLWVVPLAHAYLLQKKFDLLFNDIQPENFDKDIKAHLYVIQAQAHLARHEFVQANMAFISARRFGPAMVEPIAGQARVKLEQGALGDAEQMALSAKKIAPRSSAIWTLLGDIHYQKRDLQLALSDFSKAVQLAPGNRQAHKGKAQVLLDLGRYQDTEKEIKPVWETSPGDPRASYLYAIALARNNRQPQARAVLRDAALFINSLDPVFVQNDPPTLLISGLIHYMDDDFAKASQNLQRFLVMQPRHFSARQLFAAVLLKRNDPKGAIQALIPVMGQVRQHLQALVILGSAYTRAGRYAQAIKTYSRAMQLAPERSHLHTRLVLNQLASGRTQDALAGLTLSLRKNPESTAASVLSIMIQLRVRNFNEAYKSAASLAAHHPANPFAFNLMGAALTGLGKLDAARKNFVQALKVAPGFIPAGFNLAKLNLLEGNLDSARIGFEEILEKHPQEIGVLLELSALDGRFKHNALAAKWLQRARKSESATAAISIRLVQFYLTVNKYKEALEVAQELESKHPTDLQVLILVGRVQFAMGQREAARQVLKKMLELASNRPPDLLQVAILQMQVGDLAGASQTLRSALIIYAQYLPARVLLIDIAVRRKQFSKALLLAQKLRQELPGNIVGNLLEGKVLASMKRFSGAAAAYGRAFKMRPDASLLVQYYHAQRDAGKAVVGLRFLQAWSDKYPQDNTVKRALAAAYVDTGRLARAVRLHEQMLTEFPDDAALYNNLANLYYRQGDSRAVKFAQKAYELAPEQPATLDTLGWILVRQGQAKSGLKYLRQAHIRKAKDPRIGYHIAAALKATGRINAARQQLKKALKTGLRFDESEQARKLLLQLTGS